MKFVPGDVSDPTPLLGLNASTATSSDLPPIDPGDSSNSSSIPTILLNNSETIHNTTVNTLEMNLDSEQTPISPEPDRPEFSVEYNPEVKRPLDLHLEHVFAYECPAYSVKISPGGQRMAVGFGHSGATIIRDMKTQSNVRSVSEYLVSRLY